MGELTMASVEACLAEPKLRKLVNALIREGRLAGKATAEDLFRLLREVEHQASYHAFDVVSSFDRQMDLRFDDSVRRKAYMRSYHAEPVDKVASRARKRRDRQDPVKRERANQRRRERRQDPASREVQTDKQRAEAKKQAKLSARKKQWQDDLAAGREERKAKLRERLMPLRKVRCAPDVDGAIKILDSIRQSGPVPLVG